MSSGERQPSDEEEEEGEGEGDMKAAYSIEDMLGALTDSEEEFVDSVETPASSGSKNGIPKEENLKNLTKVLVEGDGAAENSVSKRETSNENSPGASGNSSVKAVSDSPAQNIKPENCENVGGKTSHLGSAQESGMCKSEAGQKLASDQNHDYQDKTTRGVNENEDKLEHVRDNRDGNLSSKVPQSLKLSENNDGSRDTTPSTGSASPSFKISSDIGGRFHVEGSQYSGTEVPSLPSSPPPGSSRTSPPPTEPAVGSPQPNSASGGSAVSTAGCPSTQSKTSTSMDGSSDQPPRSHVRSRNSLSRSPGSSPRSGDSQSVGSGELGQNSLPDYENVDRSALSEGSSNDLLQSDMPRDSESAFPLDASISNQSFKTEAVTGLDPFAKLRRINSESEHTELAKGPTDLPKIILSSPEGSTFPVPVRRDGEKSVTEKQPPPPFDTESFEMIDNDTYVSFDDWEGGETASNDPWAPAAQAAPRPPAPRPGSQSLTRGNTEAQVYEPGEKQQVEETAQTDTTQLPGGTCPESHTQTDKGAWPDLEDSGRTGSTLGASYEGGLSSTWEESYNMAGLHGAGTLTSEQGAEDIYENVNYGAGQGTLKSAGTGDVDGWSSDEFETYETSPTQTLELEAPPAERRNVTVRVGAMMHKRTSRSSISPDIQIPQVLDKMVTRLGDKLNQRLNKREEAPEDDNMLIQVSLNMEKHPPAEMPPVPLGLNQLQLKRRHVLAAIVESETSYLDSLRRLVKDYERPLLEAKPQILPKSVIRVIFYKMNDILQCHNMFHIELTECVKHWDEQETIGNVFTASFSKAMVFETYSAYVNNFSVAMETTKKQARTKQAFAEFLKHKLGMSPDKLSLFGLMVKPVQRFPQFIMLLQDLLKYTPRDHHDRLALQMALTELETLTHRLNDTKRDSESRYDVKGILHNLAGRHTIKQADNRYLIRHDDVISMETKDGVMTSKNRRLILLSDLLLCVSVTYKESESGTQERYKYKWSVHVRDCDVLESSVAPHYQVRSGSGKTTVTSLKPDKPQISADNPYKAEVDDMLHDLPVIEQIGQLVSQLRMKYQGLNLHVINGLMRSLQINIQQKSDVNKCVLQLSIPAGKGGGRVRMYFQVEGSDQREDWLLELQNTKLALEPKNNPGWLVPEHERVLNFKQPLFVRPLLIDVTKHDTRTSVRAKKVKLKVECAIPVLLPSLDLPGVGLQHLWVCSSDKVRGQVTIVSLHGNQPHVVESFKACESPIVCAELVPGYARYEESEAFPEDTVWMGLENNSIQVRGVIEENRAEPLTSVAMDTTITGLRYLEGRLYVALQSGDLVIYSRDLDGVWDFDNRETLHIGNAPITALLAVGRDMWVACGRCVHVVTVTATVTSQGTDISVTQHDLCGQEEVAVQCLVKASAGLFVSYKDKPTIRLYHLETMVHLQDVSVSSVIHKLIQGKHVTHEQQEAFRHVSITCMTAYKGLLWIGTSVGCVLTLPLPRLEGVPQIKVRPTVSYHSHTGGVRFLTPIHCGHRQLYMPPPEPTFPAEPDLLDDESSRSEDQSAMCEQQMRRLDGVTEAESDDYRFSQSANFDSNGLRERSEFGSNLSMTRNMFASTPDLRGGDQFKFGAKEDVQTLYGSLMRLNNEEFDAELLGMKHKRRVKQYIPGLSAMTTKATARLSQIMNKTPQSPQSKYATLPIVAEDGSASNRSSLLVDESLEEAYVEAEPQYVEAQDPDPGHIEPQGGEPHRYSSQVSETPSEHKQVYISQNIPVTLLNSTILSKSSLVVSGGEGHINWSTPRSMDLSYDDLCLLLWQYRQ